jgi:hypothetical protein
MSTLYQIIEDETQAVLFEFIGPDRLEMFEGMQIMQNWLIENDHNPDTVKRLIKKKDKLLVCVMKTKARWDVFNIPDWR